MKILSIDAMRGLCGWEWNTWYEVGEYKEEDFSTRFILKWMREHGFLAYDSVKKVAIVDDQRLFEVIAPFMKSGGIIEARGEDGAQWRFLFENGHLRNQDARIVWE